MGLGYELFNIDKKERISLTNINCGFKKRDLSGTIISSSIITFYLLSNIGDRITFIDDHSINYTLFGEDMTLDDLNEFIDVTDDLVNKLIQEKLYINKGKVWIDEEEDLYYHDLVNIWDPKMEEKTG